MTESGFVCMLMGLFSLLEKTDHINAYTICHVVLITTGAGSGWGGGCSINRYGTDLPLE